MLRRERSLTLRELAAKAHLHGTHVGNIERGLVDPRLLTILKLAKGLQVDAGVLLKEVRSERSESKTTADDTPARRRQ